MVFRPIIYHHNIGLLLVSVCCDLFGLNTILVFERQQVAVHRMIFVEFEFRMARALHPCCA